MASHNIIPRGEADFDLYPYTPSAGAGYAFLILFAIGGLTHLIMLIPLRSWFFVPFVLGCVGEAAGYYGRAWSSKNIRQGSPYLLQLMLILAAAPLLAATIYMTLGRLIRSLDATHHAVMNPRWTTKIYVIIDIGSFVCQIMGSAMQASGDPDGVKTGTTVVIAGLENITSIIASKQSKYLVKAGIGDVYIMSRNLNATAVNGTAASGPAYLRVFVNLDNQSITVVKAKIENGKNAIGALVDEVDKVIESLMGDF
ncbi:RTA1 like protein-domain-containing protein [Alternaria rosae]|uniref:RTA1 like protein-domain-containing protein n=1 Tax=Alternaria rosae TaxID=1187941 RepID=UPI001E8E7582|nr:RTA1 like protein-domain-containing protein [Alternaria rosae]KAH6875791.1 RTA1 like protein-domain-containing protein [Alternaria rosae]